MNYTNNYHLPQWEKSDRILMDDFNQMCVNLESGIRDARAEAVTARSEAAVAARLPYVTGSYTGNGEDVTVELGFRPAFLIITGMKPTNTSMNVAECDQYFALTGGNALQPKIQFTATGFQIRASYDYGVYPWLTIKDRAYDYIAFK